MVGGKSSVGSGARRKRAPDEREREGELIGEEVLDLVLDVTVFKANSFNNKQSRVTGT